MNQVVGDVDVALADVTAIDNTSASEPIASAVRVDVVNIIADDEVKIAIGFDTKVSIRINIGDIETFDRVVVAIGAEAKVRIAITYDLRTPHCVGDKANDCVGCAARFGVR